MNAVILQISSVHFHFTFISVCFFLKFQGPRPGDLIEIFRIGYEHWAIYVEDDCVVHLAPDIGLPAHITSVFSNRAVVKYSRLEDVLHGCSWKVNNKLDGTYLPLPVDQILQRTKEMVNKIVQYSLIEGNCEHFVNGLRYGVPRIVVTHEPAGPACFLGVLPADGKADFGKH
uniref:Phospholipase A and acyltransferase 5 n=1 Tax=Ursus americanus TaxID=9643 RepID=A0A452QJU1_URSAM